MQFYASFPGIPTSTGVRPLPIGTMPEIRRRLDVLLPGIAWTETPKIQITEGHVEGFTIRLDGRGSMGQLSGFMLDVVQLDEGTRAVLQRIASGCGLVVARWPPGTEPVVFGP